MQSPSRPCKHRPGLAIVVAAALVAPACLAQDSAAAPATETERPAKPVPSETAPRSPFGQVMSLLIGALQQAADEPDGRLQAAELQLRPATPDHAAEAPPAAKQERDIQVSPRFTLGGDDTAASD